MIPPGGLTFIRTAHFQGEQPGYEFRPDGVTGAGYYRHLAEPAVAALHATSAAPNPQAEPDAEEANTSSPLLWRAVVDESSGRTYYCHEKTQETRWSKPGSAAPPPPPPPPAAAAAQSAEGSTAAGVKDAQPEPEQRDQPSPGQRVSVDATLPPNWVVVANPKSTCDRDAYYYCHIVSREVRWEKPELN